MYNASEIASIKVGSFIRHSIDGVSYGPEREVVEIHARGVSITGKHYLCGYMTFGEHSTISFSISENDRLDGILYKVTRF